MDFCKPGGCSKIGCERGHYCYNPDGSKRVEKPMTEEEKKQLQEMLSLNAAMPPQQQKPAESEITDQVKASVLKLLKHQESYSFDPAVSKALKAKKDAEDRFNRNIKRSYFVEKAMKFCVASAIAAAVIGVIAVLVWGLWEAVHYDCTAESTAVLRGCEGYTAYKSQH